MIKLCTLRESKGVGNPLPHGRGAYLCYVTAAEREIPQRNSEFDKSTYSNDVFSNDIKF